MPDARFDGVVRDARFDGVVRDARFDDRVAVITGGSNGLGRAIAESFAAEGGQVLVCDLVDSGYFDGHPRVATITGDIGCPGLADEVIGTAVSRWGKADILVNDAASYPDGTLLEMPADAFDRVFRVNVTGTFMMTQAFARHCVARDAHDAAVVSISTGSARNPRPAGAAYSASKAAVETMSKVFAMELGPHGIRVNVVAPGYIDVRGWSDAFPDRAPDDLRAALVSSIPLGQAGHPRDIAAAVLFLASREAGHVTGTVLEVDGGSNAGRYSLGAHAGKGRAGDRG
ncbi:MAG TPA: SDR family oxidoreductase [Streptosporangiaceae bacterium]|nr:SDR family oxidoreductase [Streptosporangiaceae bacterium]